MNTINIKLLDIVTGTSTNAEGLILFENISKHLQKGDLIKLSLRDLTPMSSSFLNSSFGELIHHFGYAKIKTSIVLTDYRMSDALRIKNYLIEVSEMHV